MKVVRCILVAVFAGAVVAQSSPALAQTKTRPDAVGDVARSPVGSSTYTPAPSRIEGDITSTRVSHGPRAVWVTVHLRDLTTTSNGNFHRISILSDRRFRQVEIDAFPGHWEGHAVTTDAHGLAVGCAVQFRIDYVANLVVLRMPRACLRRPKWVRVAVRSTVAGTTYAYTDDARTTGVIGGLVYGPRVRR
jgi:hypothetical protein